MSKEIAQTVGTKRMAWLIALIAAFAVFATVGSQFGHTHATAATDETVTTTYGSTDSVIPIDQTIRTEVATASYAIVRVLTTVDNYLRSTPSSATLDSSQTSSYVSGLVSAVNPWKTTASTTGAWAATLDSSQTSSGTRQSSSFVTDMNSKVPVPYGVLSYAGVNSSKTASAVSLPVRQESNSAVVVSKASGVEYAPHSAAGTLVTQDMSGNGSVFESPALTASSCGSNPSCGITAQDLVSGRATSTDGGQSAVPGILLVAGLAVITLVLTIHRRNQLVFGLNSPPLVKKWRISERLGAPHLLARLFVNKRAYTVARSDEDGDPTSTTAQASLGTDGADSAEPFSSDDR